MGIYVPRRPDVENPPVSPEEAEELGRLEKPEVERPDVIPTYDPQPTQSPVEHQWEQTRD